MAKERDLLSRRGILRVAGAVALPLSRPAAAQPRAPKTLLGIGAHYDDCVFGIPGILLQAVRKHYRVVLLHLIGDYRDWAPIGDRHAQLAPAATALAKEHGVESVFLNPTDFSALK